MISKLSVILYFISFLFGPVSKREQKCHVVNDSKDKIIKVIKAEYGSAEYPVYAHKMLQEFVSIPYGGGSKGCPQAHTLINTTQMDCMTFVENYWALAFTRHLISLMPVQPSDEELFALFVQNLNSIRYYEGKNLRNEDRIQYLTSAFIQLEKAGVLKSLAQDGAKPLQKNISYVSANKVKFGGFSDWTFIRSKEAEMSAYTYYTYGKNEIDVYAKSAKDGDLIGLLTTVPGLDVSHCGVITVKAGKVCMTHASSVKKQLVYAQDLKEYLAGRSTISGIVVYRPVFPEEIKFAVN